MWAAVLVFMLFGSAAQGAAEKPARSRVRPAKRLPLYPRPAPGVYASPLRGSAKGRISSGFGWRRHPLFGTVRRHSGIDLPRPYGTWVYPVRTGVVSYAGWKGGYGWMVELRHPNGARTIYGHLARIFVVQGQLLNTGVLLGAVGSSGSSTGPHLHFEYRNAAGQAMDPRFITAL